MTDIAADTPAAAEPESSAPRTLRFSDLIDLYARPRLFFSGKLDLGDSRFLLPVVWILGIRSQIDRIETEVLRHEWDPTRTTWQLIEPLVTGHWIFFWAWCALFGVITAAIIYFLGGWWYRMRLRMSGADAGIDKELPRHLYAYSTFVMALPHVLAVVIYTIVFPNYLAAYNSDEMFSIVIPFVIFLSIAVSYSAATASYSLVPWKARLWFLILPCLFYITLVGGIIWILTLFS